MTENRIKKTDHDKLVDALRAVLIDDSSDSPLLIKRVPFICNEIKAINEGLKEMNKGFERIDKKLDEKFVTKESFWPVKTLVFGMVGIILTGVVMALMVMIIK